LELERNIKNLFELQIKSLSELEAKKSVLLEEINEQEQKLNNPVNDNFTKTVE